MSHREPNEEVPLPANPPLLKLAVALILTRLVIALSSAWFLNEVATRNEAMAFSAVALVVSIVGAIFVWQRKRWAAWTMIVLIALDVLLTLPGFTIGAGVPMVAGFVLAMLSGVALIVTLRLRPVWSILD